MDEIADEADEDFSGDQSTPGGAPQGGGAGSRDFNNQYKMLVQ